MGASKTDHFSIKQNGIARMTKAMGHPARVAIIEYLLKVNRCICDDIVQEFPLSQPTISQHLRELKNAGLIKGSTESNRICYCIDEKGVEKLKIYFTNISQKLSNSNICC
jgi:DNA-binding transcriptional ArsR family regulator